MIILFPKQPHENCVDYMFLDEWDAAKNAGFDCHIINIDSIKMGLFTTIKLPKYDEPHTAIYRGWILRSKEYGIMEKGLKNNNIHLINDKGEYEVGQYLLHSLPHFKGYSIPSVLMENKFTISKMILKRVFKQFGNSDIFLKDFVKSEPDNILVADDLDGDLLKVENFVKNRGEMLEGGLALRKFMKLSELEDRLFVLFGEILNFDGKRHYLPTALEKLIKKYSSNFFTVDISHDKDDGLIYLVETGDAQVCGLKGLDPNIFYNVLFKKLDNLK